MQQLIIVGHLGNDAEVKDLGTTQVINFSLAVSEKVKEETKTTWYKCAFFTNNVNIAPWLLKGSLIGVTGKPEIETYTAIDNSTRANLKCIVRDIKLYSSTKDRNAPNPAPTPAPAAPQKQSNYTQELPDDEPDDLPF